MVDEVLFAGGRLDSVVTTGTATEVTTAGARNATYVDAAVSITDAANIITATFVDSSFAATDVVTGETLYAHFDFYAASTTVGSNRMVVGLYDSSGFPWLQIRSNGSGTTATHGLYYNSNTGASPTWTLIDTTYTFVATTRYTIDIKLTLGSPHSVELSRDGALLKSGTFTQASLTSLRAFKASSHSNTTACLYSQILCTRGISTVGSFVQYMRATGAGSNSGWTGAFTDVNEAINSDVTLNSSATAAQKQSYAMTDITVPAGYEVKTVFQWLRGKNTGVAPNNIKSLCRSGGTDYSSSTLSGISTGFGALGARYDTNPATASQWTDATLDAVEFGFESST